MTIRKKNLSKIVTPFEREKQIIFLHTPKSAGWSISDYLIKKLFEKGEKSYCIHDHLTFEKSKKIEIEQAKKCKLVHGHFSWNTSKKLHQPYSNTFMFTTLRPPQERVISLYFFLRSLTDIAHRLPNKKKLIETYEKIKKMSPLEFLDSKEERINYQINNYLTRQFSGDLNSVPIYSPTAGVSRKRNEMLWSDGVEKSEIAMRHLLQLDDIAFIDTYDKDFRRIVRKLGLPEEKQMISNANKTILTSSDKANFVKLKDELAALLQGDFSHLIEHDNRLYNNVRNHYATTSGNFNVGIGQDAKPSGSGVKNEVTIGNDDITSTRLKGAVDFKAIPNYETLDGETRIYGKSGVGATYDSFSHTFRVGSSGDTKAMTISSAGNTLFKQSTAFDSAITSNGSIYFKDLPNGGVQAGNLVADTSDGRLYVVTPPITYTKEQTESAIDKKLVIKDKNIKKLEARLTKLEARIKILQNSKLYKII